MFENMKKTKYLIIGAGISGLAFASKKSGEDYIILEKENEIQISYTGDGFLQQMIRIMTGTLIEVGNGTKQSEDIVKILESKDRQNAGYTVPAEGLALKSVAYNG